MLSLNRNPGFPWEVEWSLTWACNASCFFCSTGKYDRSLHADHVGIVARHIIGARPLAVTLSGGEPLVHPDAPKVLDTLLESGIPTNITTNGLALSRLNTDQLSAANWIRVSLHSVSPMVSRKIMGDSYNVEKVLSNISTLCGATQKFSLFVLISSANGNSEEMLGLVRLARDVGASKIEFGVVKLIGWAHADMLAPRSRVRDLVNLVQTEATSLGIEVVAPDVDVVKHTCVARSKNAAVFPDGSVRSCSFDRDESWGNLVSEPLLDIWRRRARLDDYCDRCSPGGYQLDSARKLIPILTHSA